MDNVTQWSSFICPSCPQEQLSVQDCLFPSQILLKAKASPKHDWESSSWGLLTNDVMPQSGCNHVAELSSGAWSCMRQFFTFSEKGLCGVPRHVEYAWVRTHRRGCGDPPGRTAASRCPGTATLWGCAAPEAAGTGPHIESFSPGIDKP